MFKLSPPVVFQEILAVRGGDKPYYSPEILVAKGGTMWARNGRWILPEMPRNIQGSFTCRKFTTWDRRLYFPSEGRPAEDFFALKNPTVSAGFELAILGTKGQHATSRPPKPLCPWLGRDLVYEIHKPFTLCFLHCRLQNTHTCTLTNTHTYTLTNTQTYTLTNTHTHTHSQTHTHKHTLTNTHIYTHSQTHTHIHTHKHTHTHTNLVTVDSIWTWQ